MHTAAPKITRKTPANARKSKNPTWMHGSIFWKQNVGEKTGPCRWETQPWHTTPNFLGETLNTTINLMKRLWLCKTTDFLGVGRPRDSGSTARWWLLRNSSSFGSGNGACAKWRNRSFLTGLTKGPTVATGFTRCCRVGKSVLWRADTFHSNYQTLCDSNADFATAEVLVKYQQCNKRTDSCRSRFPQMVSRRSAMQKFVAVRVLRTPEMGAPGRTACATCHMWCRPAG